MTSCLKKNQKTQTKTFVDASLLILHGRSKISVRSREQPLASAGVTWSDRLAVASFSLVKAPSVAPRGWAGVADSRKGRTWCSCKLVWGIFGA